MKSEGGKTIKPKRRKTRAASHAVPREVARLARELDEAREQQVATAEVLRVISASTGDLQPVFETLLEKATQLCAAKFGILYLREGDAFRLTVMHNVPPAFAAMRARNPLIHPEPGSVLHRVEGTRDVVHVPDVTTEQGYIERQPRFV